MQETLRLFIAIELNPEIHLNLARIAVELKKERNDEIRWVNPDNIHLTLKFLGDTPQRNISSLSETLKQTVFGFLPFEIVVKGTGCFPDARHPRVLWAGVNAPVTLFELQSNIDRALLTIGIPKENRPFSPHLTLARLSDRTPEAVNSKEPQKAAPFQNTVFGQMLVERVTLFQSTLTPRGPIYTALVRLPLKSTG
jgi:2'-5' RNA ligase